MNQEEFKAKANDISDDPSTRVSTIVRDLLKKEDVFFDAHCHIFDKHCVPPPYFRLRMKSANQLNEEKVDDFIKGFHKRDIIPGDIDTTHYKDQLANLCALASQR